MSDRDRQTLSTHFTFYLSIVFGREYLRPFCMYTESVLSLASGRFGSAGDAQNISGSPQCILVLVILVLLKLSTHSIIVCLSVCRSVFCLSLHLSLCVCLFFYLSLYNRLSTIVHDFGPATAGAWSHVISLVAGLVVG